MEKNQTRYFAHLLNVTCFVGFAALLLSTGCVCVTSSGEKLLPVTSFPIVPADERPSLATRLTVFGNISKKDLEKEEQAIQRLFWSSGMFSSVVPANDAKEMRMGYASFMAWTHPLQTLENAWNALSDTWESGYRGQGQIVGGALIARGLAAAPYAGAARAAPAVTTTIPASTPVGRLV